MIEPITVEKYADMVMRNNKGYNLGRLSQIVARSAGRQVKRCQVYDLRTAHLGLRQCHHGRKPLFHLHNRRGGRQRRLRNCIRAGFWSIS